MRRFFNWEQKDFNTRYKRGYSLVGYPQIEIRKNETGWEVLLDGQVVDAKENVNDAKDIGIALMKEEMRPLIETSNILLYPSRS